MIDIIFVFGFTFILTIALELTWPIKTAKHSQPTVTNNTTDTNTN